ncbi:MAG: PLP-dependent transferase [Paludibacteraceae bacterium]
MSEQSFETQLLHIPYAKPDAYNALNMPVYNVAAFEFDSAEDMELAFTGKTDIHTYSRITNPTVQYFEDRVRTMTKALSVTALNSGMAAIANTLIAVSKTGGNIITSRHLFGNTYSFLVNTLGDFGVEIRFCDLTNIEDIDTRIDNQTCAIFLEIMTNPQMEVADLKAISAVATDKGVPLIADTTVIPFCVFDAKRFGVDIEIISSTKYISGGATSIGGLIVDYGNFDWKKSPKLNDLAEEFGNATFTAKLRKEIHRNLGAYMTPQTAYIQSLGLETLLLRYNRAADTCLELATRLKGLAQIKAINYNSLPGNRFYEISKLQFGEKAGAMFTFDLDSKEMCFAFLNNLKLIKRATNLFDNKTLAIHPASTIYGTFSATVRREMDISDKTIRISVGMEDVEDLFCDMKQALQS